MPPSPSPLYARLLWIWRWSGLALAFTIVVSMGVELLNVQSLTVGPLTLSNDVILLYWTVPLVQASKWLFYIGVGHVVVLVLATGFGLYSGLLKRTVGPGGLVSMTGYVHTLIGMMAALLNGVRADPSSLSSIPATRAMLLAIAMAIATSIIGWSFGREFQRRDPSGCRRSRTTLSGPSSTTCFP